MMLNLPGRERNWEDFTELVSKSGLRAIIFWSLERVESVIIEC